ncbi:MAG: isochorismatase family protein [Chloroflexota bacterium]
MKNNSHSLLVADDSLLVVVDVQSAFLNKLSIQENERLLNKICWIVRLSQWRQIPIIITAEELTKQPLADKLTQILPPNMPIYNKMVFGLADQPDIFAAVEQTRRKTAILIGLETDVCITHSAIGLLERGYRVIVVEDAVGSPESGQKIGLARMQNAGVIIVSMKSLFYEWLRTVEAVNRFHRELPEMDALAGVTL